MAPTKRKRRTKHRGNAAGIVETRGRTGRRPTASERTSPSRGGASTGKGTRVNRYEKPPTWRSAATRGAVIAVIGAVLIGILSRNVLQGASLFVLMLIFYIPFTYYTDLWLHRRWVRRQGKRP